MREEAGRINVGGQKHARLEAGVRRRKHVQVEAQQRFPLSVDHQARAVQNHHQTVLHDVPPGGEEGALQSPERQASVEREEEEAPSCVASRPEGEEGLPERSQAAELEVRGMADSEEEEGLSERKGR